MSKIIKEVNFNNLSELENNDYVPILLSYKNQMYEFKTNKRKLKSLENLKDELLTKAIFDISRDLIKQSIRIIYYLLSKNEEVSKVIDTYSDTPLANTGKVFFKRDVDIFLFGDENNEEWIKFSPSTYVNSMTKIEKKIGYYRNVLEIVRFIIKKTNIMNDLKIYVAPLKDLFTQESEQEINQIVRKKKYSIKQASRFIAYIESVIYNSKEKLLKIVENKFQQYAMIGDIVINEEEECILNEYMGNELKRYVEDSRKFEPKYDKLFALGLVKFASKNYENKVFWKFFYNEYGVNIPSSNNKQTILINDKFRKIMKMNKKEYEDIPSDYIHNVVMHSFVADKYAFSLFDYLFDYWNTDLYRNIENLYDSQGKIIKEFNDDLINDMKVANSYIKQHTAMAIRNNEVGSKNRIRHIIQLIDNAWNDGYIYSNNRINNLFNNWLKYPESAYCKELENKKRNNSKIHKEHEINFHKPILKYNKINNKFLITLPRQRLKQINNTDDLKWELISSNNIKQMDAKLKQDRRGYYVDDGDCFEIDNKNIFGEFKIYLKDSENNILYKNIIKKDDLRMFDEEGIIINYDYSGGGLKEGSVTVFTKDNNTPYLIGINTSPIECEDYTISNFYLNKGDVMILPSNHALQVGLKLEEGIVKVEALEGMCSLIDGKEYRVYNKKPHYLFKTNTNMLKGTKLIINDESFTINESDCYKFIINEKIEEEKYGYIIDLSNYLNGNGLYKINVNVTGSRSINYCEFVYLEDFSYSYENAPYFYKTVATIVFNTKYNFLEQNKNKDKWEIDTFRKKYVFCFNESDKDVKENVKEGKLFMNLQLEKEFVELVFDIPSFYWKENKDDIWNVSEMEDTPLKNLKDKIYVKGPFDFENAKVFINGVEENYVKYEKVKGTKEYYINLNDLISSIKYNRESVGETALIQTNLLNDKISLFRVICKSKLIGKPSLYYGEKDNILKGEFNIRGDNTYSVTIKYKDEIILEDMELINGYFEKEFEKELKDGEYEITITEYEDNNYEDDIFEDTSISFTLGKPLKINLFNFNKLAGKTLKLINIARISVSDSQINFKNNARYLIDNLVRFNGDYEDLEPDIYSYDDIDVLNDLIVYKGELKYRAQYQTNKLGDILVIFREKPSMNDVIILKEDKQGRFSSLEFDKNKRIIIKDEDELKYLHPLLKFPRIAYLSDDKYRSVLEVED